MEGPQLRVEIAESVRGEIELSKWNSVTAEREPKSHPNQDQCHLINKTNMGKFGD